PVQGRGVGVDAVGGAVAAGVGRPGGAGAGVRAAGDARSLPAPAAPGAGGLPVRARRERACDPRLRSDRDAADDLVPFADLLIRVALADPLRRRLGGAYGIGMV